MPGRCPRRAGMSGRRAAGRVSRAPFGVGDTPAVRFEGGGPLGCLGDVVVEVVLALLACGLVLLLGVGFTRAPALTTAIVAPIGAFAGYGAWLLVFRRHSGRLAGRIAFAAVASAILLAVLLIYVLQYCACAVA
jgi:hypothetical protein